MWESSGTFRLDERREKNGKEMKKNIFSKTHNFVVVVVRFTPVLAAFTMNKYIRCVGYLVDAACAVIIEANCMPSEMMAIIVRSQPWPWSLAS